MVSRRDADMTACKFLTPPKQYFKRGKEAWRGEFTKGRVILGRGCVRGEANLLKDLVQNAVVTLDANQSFFKI